MTILALRAARGLGFGVLAYLSLSAVDTAQAAALRAANEAGLTIDVVALTGGRLVITGSTAKRNMKVKIVGTGFSTRSAANKTLPVLVESVTQQSGVRYATSNRNASISW